LSDNEIQKVENFPSLQRLQKLFIANNHVNRVAEKIATELPNLDTIILSNNRITNLAVIDSIAANKKLAMLSLLENPVIHRPKYRLYTIFKIPSLTVLDYKKVTQKERDAANKQFASSDETADGQTFVPGAESAAAETAPIGRQVPTPAPKPTPQQIEALKMAIANASTPAEVRDLWGFVHALYLCANLPI
jgi:U2 small nuclear ribonucleoprotein A'